MYEASATVAAELEKLKITAIITTTRVKAFPALQVASEDTHITSTDRHQSICNANKREKLARIIDTALDLNHLSLRHRRCDVGMAP